MCLQDILGFGGALILIVVLTASVSELWVISSTHYKKIMGAYVYIIFSSWVGSIFVQTSIINALSSHWWESFLGRKPLLPFAAASRPHFSLASHQTASAAKHLILLS